MAIANTKVYGHNLDLDIRKQFFDGYIEYPAEYSRVAKIENYPDHAGDHITESELSPLGDLGTIYEGQGVEYDTPVQGNKKTVHFTKYGKGFQITEEMMRDDVQRNFRGMPGKLAKSARMKIESVYWDLFNSGFATHTAGDGQYIFDTDHQTLKSKETISNDGTAASLSETSLQAAFQYYDTLKDDAGNPMIMRPKYLVYPTQLRWTVQKFYKGSLKVGSMDNDINTVAPANMPEDWMPFMSRWLTSSTAWFLVSDDHDMRLIWRFPTRMESKDDFHTGNALFKVTQRFAAACWLWRGVYGNTGA